MLEKGDERRTIIKAAANLTAHESFLDKREFAQNNVKTPNLSITVRDTKRNFMIVVYLTLLCFPSLLLTVFFLFLWIAFHSLFVSDAIYPLFASPGFAGIYKMTQARR